MRPRPILAAAGLVLALAPALAAGRAAAAGRVAGEGDGARATFVLRLPLCLEAGRAYTFETARPSAVDGVSADTVLRLVDEAAGGVEVAWDDDGGEGLASRIEHLVPAEPGGDLGCRDHTLLVHAYSNASGGAGGHAYDLLVDGERVARHRLGGYRLPIAPAAGDAVEAVLVDDGAAAVALVRLDGAGAAWRLGAFVEGGGAGEAARAVSDGRPARWLAATPAAHVREGPARVLVNDAATADADGDGLGDALEAELGTCAGPAGPAGGPACAAVANPGDTDRDGLGDALEVLGLADEEAPQLLPLWGADPRHKDVFVEMDVLEGRPGSFHEPEAVLAAGRFAGLAGVDNPDGRPGVAVHFDVRGACSGELGDVDGISAVCGPMGGAGIVPGREVDCGDDRGHLTPIRRGLFHWGIETGGGSGAAPGTTFCHDDRWTVVAHELGHNLGLQHWGVDADGVANTKPHYPSSMSYLYQDHAEVAFSDGTRGPPLDPAAVSELAPFGAGADLGALGAYPYAYPVRAATGDVDWNRDGRYDPSVRAHVCCAPHRKDYEGEDIPVNVGNENLPLGGADVGPGAAVFRRGAAEAVYVVVNDASTRRFRATFRAGPPGAPWAPPFFLGGQVLGARSEPAAAVHRLAAGGERLVVLGATAAGEVRFTLLDADGLQADAEGRAGAWSSLGAPDGARFESVAAAASGGRLYVVARDAALVDPGRDDLWIGALDPGLAWSGWTRARLPGGADVESELVTPAIAAAPDGRLLVAVRQKRVSSPRHRDVDLYAFSPAGEDLADGRWALAAPAAWRDGPSGCELGGRPGLAFRRHRTAEGEELPTGAVWLWYPVEGDQSCWGGGGYGHNLFYRFSWGRLEGGAADAWDPGLYHKSVLGAGACWTGPGPGTGVALADAGRSLEAFAVQRGSERCAAGQIFHVPFADGTSSPARPLADTDDGRVIRDGVCESLNQDCPARCDGSACKRAGGPPAPPRVVVCDPEEELL